MTKRVDIAAMLGRRAPNGLMDDESLRLGAMRRTKDIFDGEVDVLGFSMLD